MTTRFSGILATVCASAVLFAHGGLMRLAHAVDFNRDIRPILAENCVHCHGPDAESRSADLRLDTEAGSRMDLGGYFAIVPGKPLDSEVWLRVIHEDRDELMPPPKSKRRLTEQQKALLKEWIEQGAEYEQHWAYEAPVRPGVEGGNPVDFFVHRRLQEEGVRPSEPADRRTLIRRVSLDLIGLPPTPEEIEAFLQDRSPEAYEKLVDRLLASPRFGERWARPWLDLARYADSNGFQADQLRDSWAYRDWVIDALNANMPFDRFTIEQLAGDLLPNATVDQKIATGFHRTVTCNVEAGVHPEANRVNQVADRVNTTGTVWLGTTMECAQCHDHKYDPFSMKDYYGIFAYFNNTPLEVENPSGQGVSFNFYGPKMELPLEEAVAAERRALQKELGDLKKELKVARTASLADKDETLALLREQGGGDPDWETLGIVSISGTGGESFDTLDDGSGAILVLGKVPDKTRYTVQVRAPKGKVGALRIGALTNDQLPGNGPGRGDPVRRNFILSEVRLEADGESVPLIAARADFSQNGWEVAKAIDGDPKTGWAISPQFGKPHWASFALGRVLEGDGKATWTLELDQFYGRGRTIGCLRVSATERDSEAMSVPKDISTLLTKAKLSAKEQSKLDDYLAGLDPEVKRLQGAIGELQERLDEIAPATTLVMVEMEEARDTFIMKRGDYLNPGESVAAATPVSLHPADEGLPENRLGFAQWLMDPANPLVARVTVNRWWSALFGHGIVLTEEDFGTQSTPPTYPDLLDWLAVEFVESGWNMKHLLKTMVMSAAYRQQSTVTPGLLQRDPTNELYARGARFRLDAEMIRDNALVASGLLSTKMHGPPIMPYQPKGIWRQVGRNEPKWLEARDEDRFRRGVYVVWRRAAPYPSFVNFDGPDRSACVVKRPRTNTPLQALTLLNDPAYVEMAVALASRVLSERAEGSVDERLDHAFELVLGRPAEVREREVLAALLREKQAAFAKDPKAAEEVVKGDSFAYQPPAALDPRELAAWFFVANVLLNLDETVTRG